MPFWKKQKIAVTSNSFNVNKTIYKEREKKINKNQPEKLADTMTLDALSDDVRDNLWI